jgi:predicted metal-dependent phosphoesterase TrpH
MIDLHTHSIFSDGSYTPKELIEEAAQIGLKAIALTDHDSVNGCMELQQAAQKHPNLIAINGCEMKVDHPADIEIIALNITDLSSYFERQTEQLRNRREACQARLEKLNNLGYKINWSDVAFDEKGQARQNFVKPHIVNFLFNTNQIPDKEYAYKHLLNKECPAYVKVSAPSVESTIDFIRQTKAVAILAHPCLIKLKGQDLFNEIARLKKIGLQGIEVQHSDMSIEQMHEYNQLADALGLLKSGGSDFHGTSCHYGVKLGVGRGQLNIPDEYIEKILKQ